MQRHSYKTDSHRVTGLARFRCLALLLSANRFIFKSLLWRTRVVVSAAHRKYFNFLRRRSRGIAEVNVARKNPGNHFVRALARLYARKGDTQRQAARARQDYRASRSSTNVIFVRAVVLDKVVSNTLPLPSSFSLP